MKRAAHHRGISLLEVLIAIGIVAIGLVSIVALIPVGAIQVQKANVQERTATLGLNAAKEFQVRGMHSLQGWLRYNGANWVSYLPLNLTVTDGATLPPMPDQPFLPPVAIDPLMVAVGQAEGKSAAVSTFPANYAGGPLMPRLTLTSAATVSVGIYTPNRSLADLIQSTADDVISDLPDDHSQIGTASTANGKLDSNGEYTWLATIAPSFANPPLVSNLNAVPNTVAMPAPQPTNQYTLSIVVFDRRILTTPIAATEEQGQEEIVLATSATPTTVSIHGGEFTLSDDSSKHANASGKLSMVRPDQWLMLARYLPFHYTYQYKDSGGAIQTGSVNYPMTEAKWYRVVGAANTTTSGTVFSRQVTLAGADWEPDPTAANAVQFSANYIPPGNVTWPTSVPSTSRNYSTCACLFDGAVGIYQKVIHLEGSSVWSQ